MPPREVLFEGVREEDILNLPKAEVEQLIPLGEPIVFRIGTAILLGSFKVEHEKLVIELAQIEGGGEGVLVSLSALATRHAKLRELSGIEWIVHAVSCAKPNLKLRRVLERRGFVVKQIGGVGEAYYLPDPVRWVSGKAAVGRGILMDENRSGRPLPVDHDAQSSSHTEPAFVCPEGAPVYHGCVPLNDLAVDGFTLGKITDWEGEPCETGDAFVIAPDGSRAGLVCEACDTPYFQQVIPIEVGRWGVWGVGFLLPMTSRVNARKNLKSIVPQLIPRWAEWKSRFNHRDD